MRAFKNTSCSTQWPVLFLINLNSLESKAKTIILKANEIIKDEASDARKYQQNH